MKDESGFSLMEMLFVLMIVMLLSFIAVPAIHKVYVEREIDQFFTILDSDIRFIQNQALEGRKLEIYLGKNEYRIKEKRKGLLKTRNYPDIFNPVTIDESRIAFWNTGTIKNPRTYMFSDKKGRTYSVIFPLGKGRHYIEEN